MIKKELLECLKGNHVLKNIYMGTEKDGTHKNIQWCITCGTIVIEVNQDEIGKLPSCTITKMSNLFFSQIKPKSKNN